MKKINCFSQVQELTLLLIASLVEEIILNKAQHHSNKCDDIFFIHSMAGLCFMSKTQEILQFLLSTTSFTKQQIIKFCHVYFYLEICKKVSR
ncbi:hypothetical protein CICLE_v10023070mg [Citrus x clementina]|uniref:Uncharacterized protein n=1 Tax=Citrus clementina TaxID=85681 RepID=V4TYH3_CITCL|nr:hypothetical protein CICLE_v10023070mg [Citrus x clementina]